MFNLKNIRMKPKLIGLFLLAGLIPLAVVGWFSSDRSSESLMGVSFSQLKSVREIKKVQIEKYFEERRGDMEVLVKTVNTLRLEAFRKLNGIRDAKKQQIEQYFNDRLKLMVDVQKNLRFTTAVGLFTNAISGGLDWGV